ncbi:nucleotidyltransferase domain-containing protein [Microvirga pakistanensis]|uniref:nucleotidyltransferase domain-containing protein n=1 Tax=Microvirga pakistanensis TaxID=1682650 RepID=UPI00141B7D57|nr:nucleotidyltransferase domain-containing protein [Microvirga pakistanensis]
MSQRVYEYLNLLDRGGCGFVQGIYIVGSVALGDYQEGRSDIDFVALVEALPGGPHLESLARIHAAMAASEGPPFDGFYIEQDQLGRTSLLGKRVPFSLHGAFHADAACPEVNPVTWLCLAHHGIAVRGSPPETLDIRIDPAPLHAFQVHNRRCHGNVWSEGYGLRAAA